MLYLFELILSANNALIIYLETAQECSLYYG